VIVRYPKLIDPADTGVLFKPLRVFGFRISTNAGDRKAFLIFVLLAFAILFVMLELVRRSRWARRWIAIADSPAAAATVGINLTMSKIAVFALSGTMAGFAGCMLGLSSGSLRVDSFPLFAGLPLVLLLAAQGVRYPVACFMGVLGLASFPALYEVMGQPSYLTSVELLGPGLAAIAMAYRPEGAVFYGGRALAPRLPWRRDAKEDKAMLMAKRRAENIHRDEINDLGLSVPFTIEKVAQLDRALHIADEMLERPGRGEPVDEGGLRRGAPVR
jgi:hypothetical protein